MARLPNDRGMAEYYARKYGIPPAILWGLIEQESQWNPYAKNPKTTASGLGQILRATAKELGIKNVFDPQENLDGAARYLASRYKATGKWDTAVAAYHAGLGTVLGKWNNTVQRGFKDAQGTDTYNYVQGVFSNAQKYGGFSGSVSSPPVAANSGSVGTNPFSNLSANVKVNPKARRAMILGSAAVLLVVVAAKLGKF